MAEKAAPAIPEKPPQASRQPIGRASATERDPNSSEQFSFWLAPDALVNPFDIVEAEHVQDSRTYGLVVNIQHITDAPSHLSNYISNDFGDVTQVPSTPRQGTNVAEVDVLSNNKDLYMPIPSEASVRFADEPGIHVALGIDEMMRKQEHERRTICIPAGVIEMSNGTRAVAYIDMDYVLGPESAHVNISGISGLATKTSYGMFLIQSILQKANAKEIGVIILNVKHGDLLTIDQPARALPPEELKLWDALQLKPQPFDANYVHYLLPHGKETLTTRRPNCFGEPPTQYAIYAYSLRDAYDKLDLMFSQVPDPWETISTLIGEVHRGIEGREPKWRHIETWDDLLNREPLMREGIPQAVAHLQPSSVGRFVRHLRRIVKTRQTGLFVSQRARADVNLGEEIEKIKGGHTYVVDIAKLKDEEQTLVFGDILRTIYDLYAESPVEREDLPRRVIIFVDELNKYAPARGAREGSSPILDQVLDIAERGRSLGVILVSAQQFMSAVHPRVTGNCATRVIGRSDSAELSDSSYRFLNPEVKMHLTRLEKGELLLSHPIYRQPVKIKFPRPAFRQVFV